MNFAPRLKAPVLMINGRYDFVFPWKPARNHYSVPLVTPAQDKKRVLYDTGQMPPILPIMKDTLDWFDHYLGPVE